MSSELTFPPCAECNGAQVITVPYTDGTSKQAPCPFCARVAPTQPAPAPAPRWEYPYGGEEHAAMLLATRRTAVVMVGPPGAGKSEWIKEHMPDCEVASADEFFYKRGRGRYEFDASLLSKAHEQCLLKWVKLCDTGARGMSEASIAVDNTNVGQTDFAPYIALALAHGFHVLVIHVLGDAKVCLTRNRHSVPSLVINRMLGVLQRWHLPSHWSNDPRVSVLTVRAR